MPRKKPQGHFNVSKVDVQNKPKALAYSIHFVAKSLARKDGLLGKSDPFLMIYSYMDAKGKKTDTLNFVAKTEWIKDELDPVWEPLTLSVHSCGGLHEDLTVAVYDYDSDGGHVCNNTFYLSGINGLKDLIGTCHTTLWQLVTSKPTLLFIDEKKQGRTYNNSGTLSVGTATETAPIYDDNIFRINLQLRARNLDNKDTLGKSGM